MDHHAPQYCQTPPFRDIHRGQRWRSLLLLQGSSISNLPIQPRCSLVPSIIKRRKRRNEGAAGTKFFTKNYRRKQIALFNSLLSFECVLRPVMAEERSSLMHLLDLSSLQVYHDFEFEVRDYELDQYGVVNNAVYSQYMEHGYIKMLEKIGVDFVSDGYFAATYEKYLKFTAPLKRKDRFVVKVKVEKVSSTRLFFECVMLKLPNREVIIGDHIHLLKILMNCFPSVAHQLVLEGRSTIVWLDKNYRPIRVPFEVR